MTLHDNGPGDADGPDEFTAGAAYVDGEIVPVQQARIPILDTGLTRSDVTYDVASVWEGAFFRLDDHLERFRRNCDRLRLEVPDQAELARLLTLLVQRSDLRAAYVEVLCTRGIPVGGSRDPRTYRNRLYAYAIPYVWILRPEDAERGMDAVIVRDTRRIPTDSVDPTVKNFHWADLTRGLFEAYDRGGNHPILLGHDGLVTEGPGYNLFVLIDGELVTPATGVLEGITRRTVLELASERGIAARAADVSEAMLRDAREVFGTSTAGGVMPVTSIDGEPVGAGGIGPITRMLRDQYWEAHRDPRYATPVDYPM